MKQHEMSNYLKFITIGVGILLLIFVLWFLPVVLRDPLLTVCGNMVYRGTCIFVCITSIPCFMCLGYFWGICTKIGLGQSFSVHNAVSLKRMSHLMIIDTLLYTVFLIWFCTNQWINQIAWLIFPILLAICICITLAVVCIVLSHLAHKASVIQEEQELTI